MPSVLPEKKRKATSTLESRPKKKQQTSTVGPPGAVKVEHVASADVLKPVIATIPGASFPSDVKFSPFAKKTTSGSQLLIQSSDHPTIDYIAVEGSDPSESHLKHYIAVYDPIVSSLKLTEAKSLTVRGSIRQHRKVTEDESDEEAAEFMASQGTRAALTEAFGSKKSRKAVQSMAENRQLGQGLEGATIAEAISSQIKDEDEEEEDTQAAAATAQSNKPLPQPNLQTDNISEVYSISNLVFPKPASNTLKMLPVDHWKARLKIGKEISGIRSRFVANRLGYIGKQLLAAKDEPQVRTYTQQMQLLRYIVLLLEIAHYTSKQDRRRRMDFVDKWPEGTLTGNISQSIVRQTINYFFPENTPSDRAMTLLKATILALTLHVLPPSGTWGANQLAAEPTDIQLDLAMKADEVRKLYLELGCKTSGATDRDLATWGLSKLAKKNKGEDGVKLPKPVFAVLKFPLAFPKISARRARK